MGGATTSVKLVDCVCAGELESFTCTVNVEFPAAVGVPERTPALDRLSPGGSEPDVIDQVYAGVPPVAARVALYGAPKAAADRLVVEMAS